MQQLSLEDFKPCFLISTPQLVDPHFHQTVLLLIEYHDEGAVGLVVNRPLNVTLGAVQAPKVDIAETYRESQLWYGGPISSDHILCLYATEGKLFEGDTDVAEGVAVASAEALLEETKDRPPFPGDFRIIVGHSGWVAGQLDEELREGSWLVAPLDAGMIFTTEPDNFWQAALKTLGIDPAHLHDAHTKTPS